MTANTHRILFVDDERNILDAFRRQFRNRFSVEVAVGGAAGITALQSGAPTAVVISDMRMPEMNGVEFLREVKRVSPDTVRMMLTGNNDQATAAQAVNEGNIFRFLVKPCKEADLAKALEDALAQYQLVTAEKDLLQNTLTGSVKMLTDVLGAADPQSFSESIRLRDLVKKVAAELALPISWDIELAAMLANIGFVTVPIDVAKKFRSGKPLLKAEEEIIGQVPNVGYELLVNIPRLEPIATLVKYHQRRLDSVVTMADGSRSEEIPIGSQIIKLCKDYLLLEAAGNKRIEALQKLQGRRGWYDKALLQVLTRVLAVIEKLEPITEEDIFEISPDELCPGQILRKNIETKDGRLLLTEGSRLTQMNVMRLVNYERLSGLKRPLYVDCRIPSRATDKQANLLESV